MIKTATFTSVWDDCIEIESTCQVDTKTRTIFDIEQVDPDDLESGNDIDSLTREYVTVDGEEYPCFPKGTPEDEINTDNYYTYE